MIIDCSIDCAHNIPHAVDISIEIRIRFRSDSFVILLLVCQVYPKNSGRFIFHPFPFRNVHFLMSEVTILSKKLTGNFIESVMSYKTLTWNKCPPISTGTTSLIQAEAEVKIPTRPNVMLKLSDEQSVTSPEPVARYCPLCPLEKPACRHMVLRFGRQGARSTITPKRSYAREGLHPPL